MKIFAAAVVTLTLLTGCQAMNQDKEPMIGMANPASVFCVENGGQSEIKKTPLGDVGMCHLPDGRVIEEWELYRAHNPN